jgi:thymidylate kinase
MIRIENLYQFILERPFIFRRVDKLISNGTDCPHATLWLRDLYVRILNVKNPDWIDIKGLKSGNLIFNYLDCFEIGNMIEVRILKYIKEQLNKMNLNGTETDLELIDIIHKYKLEYLPFSYILNRIKRKNMTYVGKQIFLEGIDRIGKSTIYNGLRKVTIGFKFVFEPGFTEEGSLIRKEVLTNSSLTSDERNELFVRDRKLTFEAVVKEALYEGGTVISDRGFLTGLAYRRAEGVSLIQIGEEFKRTLRMYDCSEENFREITTIILFELDDETYKQRRPDGKLDTTEDVDLKMVNRRRLAYKEILLYLNLNHHIINGANSFLYNLELVRDITGTFFDEYSV